MKELDNLKEYQKEINDKSYTSQILNWDLKINNPKKSKEHLIDIKSKIDLEIFELQTSDKYKELLDDCLNSSEFSSLDERIQILIKELAYKYDLNKRVPADFYQEYSKLQSLSEAVWEEAKAKNDYEMFKPYLEKIINMTKEYYTYLHPDMDLYDSMLNEFEKGMTSDVIDVLFDELKEALIPLIKKVTKEKSTPIDLKREYSDSELINSGKYLLDYMGFDLERGALGVYPHGFTEKLAVDDVRIAFDHTNDPISFVLTIIHEGGHGLLEQNVDREISDICKDSLENLYGLHESQSRFFENILARNINFWIPIYDDIKKKLKIDLSLEEFEKALNKVDKGLIRVDADELTYCLHIILRYEIERDIFSGKITVDDLPKVWNEKMKEYLGVEVPSDKEGVLQDVHWSDGSFGYFPSYLLGNIYDGMFLENIEENLGNVDELLRNGKIKDITNYLIEKIYKNGGVYTSKEVIERVCHKEISAKPIINYFYKKYDK